MTLAPEEGEALVRYARDMIESRFGGKRPKEPEILENVFSEKRGVFVTLETHPTNELRGCIGIIEPVMELREALADAAASAAFGDSRFNPVKRQEMDSLVVEVSVLTKPEQIDVKNPAEYPKEVVVGRDGLIVEKGFFRGLLLPQVAVEHEWDAEEFLSHTCMKAGLNPDAWLVPRVKIYRFSAQIFSETEPHGAVVEKTLTR